jgi:hypothetical protein
MKSHIPHLICLWALVMPLSAVQIGSDGFNYPEGPIDGNNGGTGWAFNWSALNQSNSGGISAWEYPSFGDAANQYVSDNTLTTGLFGSSGGSLRRYGNDRVNAAVQGTGQIFYKVRMTRSSGSIWSGLSHMDFGNEKVKFGVPFDNAGTDTIGIEVLNTAENGITSGTINLVDDTTYTLVCVLDFTNDKVAMFVDPDGTDYWTASGNNSADVVRAFPNGNWSSDVRLASGGDTTWDDLVVGTTAADVGLQMIVDADGDGLSGDWEIANNLDDNDNGTGGESAPGAKDGPNGALGDPDSDGLTNREEFNGFGIPGFDGGTHPKIADTDDDGLNDGQEVGTYSTDPLASDSDNDEIKDGEEVLAGVDGFVTNPNVADTDTGGTNDGTEVSTGTNPQVGNGGDDLSTNGNLALVGIESFDYGNGAIDGRAGGDGFDFDNLDQPDAFTGHTGRKSDWDTLWGNPQVIYQRLQTQESGAMRQFNGLGDGAGTTESSGAILSSPGVITQANSIIWVRFDMKRSSGAFWSGLSLFRFDSERAFIGVPGSQGAADELAFERPGSPAVVSGTPVILTDGVSHQIVARIDPANGFVDIYLDPNLAGSEPNPEVDAAIMATYDPADITAIRLASGGSGPTEWDNLCVAGTWAGLSTPPAATGGLRHSFAEGFNLLDGPSGNNDGDGFTNLQEQQYSTNPNLADTDADLINDDVEVNGTANAFPNPATDPNDPDIDGDGILDGQEIYGTLNALFANAPTNPHVADTDADGYDDLTEIQYGTNPNAFANNPGTLGIVVVDGSRDSLYGTPIAVQPVDSSFGNNEINAAHAYVSNGKLYLLITGNLENNFNKLGVFFDTGNQITTNLFTSAGNDTAANMNGMTFDAGFSPEYHMILRNGFDGAVNRFDLDYANLATQTSNSYLQVFGNSQTGSGITGTGTVNSSPIRIAYDNSNTAGINDGVAGGVAADQVAAAAVTTGIELSIDLADLGNPSGAIRIMVLLANDQHNFLSNQSLAGVPVGTDHLANPALVDFSSLVGDQFFTVALPPVVAPLGIKVVSYNGVTMVVDVTGAQPGKTYEITSSPTLSGFGPTGIIFTSATATGISIPANATTTPRQFFRAELKSN